MPLANSVDPWRAQIGTTNTTVVSSTVSFFFFILTKRNFHCSLIYSRCLHLFLVGFFFICN